jgi:hypothetical protein
LIRDVRAWTISRLNNRKNSPNHYKLDGGYIERLAFQLGWKINLVKWILPVLTRMPLYYFVLWYLQNKQIKNYLERHRIDYFSLGYDELGMNPQLMMKKIFAFLEEDIVNPDFSSVNSQSHVLVGNTQKRNTKRRRGIFYDNRWMYRNEWLLSAAVFRNIMNYNAREVYRNIKTGSIWDS